MDGFKETKIGIIPENWDLIKSKDFCSRVTDGTHDTPKPQTDGYYLVTSKNLIEDKIDFSTCYYISERDFNQINQRSAVEQFDVLFGMIGTVGNTAIINQPEIDFAIKNVGLFKLGGDFRKAVWLKNYLSSHIFSNYLKRQMAGTTQQFVGLGFLRKSPIPVPKKSDGRCDWQTVDGINHILSKLDDAIEATQKSKKAAEKLKKALMQNLLTGKLKPDGTWRTEDEFWEDEKFGKVPVGWEVKTIRQLFDFHPTASYARSKLIEEGEIGYIHYGDIHTKFHRILDLKTTSTPFIPNELEKKYEKLKDGDLIISDASEDWEGVGKSIEIINSENKKVIAGLHTLHLRPTANDLILGIKGYIMNMYRVSVSIKRMATGAKVYGVSKSSLANISLPIPTEPEQHEIKRRLDKVSDEINAKHFKIKSLQRLKKSLMQNLLTGKVRLPEGFIKQFEEEVETSTNEIAL